MPFECGSGLSFEKTVFFVIYVVIQLVFEWWLPRTKRVKANSTIELILTMLRILWSKTKGDKNDKTV
jgi:hypothetical protein